MHTFKLKTIALAFLFTCPSISPSVKAQKISATDIQKIHTVVEKYINYNRDSCLVLIKLASTHIDALNDKALKASLRAANNLAQADLWAQLDEEKARRFLHRAHQYYKEYPNNKKLAEIYLLKGQLHKYIDPTRRCIIAESLFYFDTALTYALAQSDPFTKATIYYEQGYSLQQMERWQESFQKALSALNEAKQAGDSLILAATHFLMGRTYRYFGLTNQSERFLKKSVDFGKGIDGIHTIIEVYACILLENNKFNQAIDNYSKALALCLADKNTPNALRILTKIGRGQLKHGHTKAAEKTFLQMNNLLASYDGDPSPTLLFTAQIQVLQGKNKSAIQSLKRFTNRYNSTVFRAQSIDLYRDVAQLYSQLNMVEEAATYYSKWGALKDSLHVHTTKLQLGEMERMYLTERDKNEEILEKNIALQKSKTQQASLGSLLLFVILLGGSIIYYIRLKSLRRHQALQGKQLEQLIQAQEVERQRLARELHDGVGQSLAALKMQLQLDNNVHSSTCTVNKVDALCKEVRTLSHQMMPLILKENGLPDALKQLTENSFDINETEIDFLTHGLTERLTPNLEVHLYRITQELITNILKHAHATKVGIQLLLRGKILLLIVEDNGLGFNTAQGNSGMGLANIRSRLEALNGHVKIQSSKHEGTYIRIVIPLEASSSKKTA
jgi:signal transduction histidine kinase